MLKPFFQRLYFNEMIKNNDLQRSILRYENEFGFQVSKELSIYNLLKFSLSISNLKLSIYELFI
jgi:hypothetical protein